MSGSLNPVFGQWYTDRQLGNGTDGKVFTIYKENIDTSRDTSVLKIIRLGENRNERKLFLPNHEPTAEDSGDYYDSIIKKIIENIEEVKEADGGKCFVRYEDVELRRASDGKGRLILIKLEQAKSLTEILKEISFTHDEALRLGINICTALVKCRSFDYIYPNLKPENILFDADGRCKLGDFGTFSFLEPAKSSVAFKRTQYYMAPEFIRTGNINCTADTYSLGLVLYMLTNRGRLPFTEPYPEKITVNLLNESVNRRISGEKLEKPVFASDSLWKIISKACAFNPNKRYFSPEQMLSDLKSALNNEPFDEPKYDDVYSKSILTDDEEENILIPDVEEVKTAVEKITPSASVKEEIQIPEIVPVYNKKNNKKNKVTKFEMLPEIKKTTPGNDKKNIRKLVVFALIAIVMLIMFVTSVVLHFSDGNEPESVTAVIQVALKHIYIYGGVF